MIFPNLELEKIVQVNDKTRLDATKSYISKDEAAITLVEIEPYAGAGFIAVTGTSSDDYYLDWEYATDGVKVVSCRITTDGAPTTITKNLTIISVVDDNLLSSDADIVMNESDILKYVRPGRNSFLDYHRRAQERVIAYLDENQYRDDDGNKLEKIDIVDIADFTEWSKFLTLSLIYQDLSNAIDDVFDKKSKYYDGKMLEARSRLSFKIDLDDSGTVTDSEVLDHKYARLIRR